MVGLLVALHLLRNSPEVFKEIYDAGDVLDTHRSSSLSMLEFARAFGHVEFALVVGLVVIIAGGLAREKLASALVGSFAFAVVFADSVTMYATSIAGRLYLKHCDDAMISMRYARNFAEGRGLVYNPGEAVDGFSNPLWTWIMVIPHALGLHEGVTTIPIAILACALLIATALLIGRVLDENALPSGLRTLVCLIVAFDASVFEFGVAGLETPLLGFGSALFAGGVLLRRERWVNIGLPILVLARADGAVVAGALVLWAALDEARETGDRLLDVARRQWRRIALLIAVSGALIAWRFALYGHPAPNTYYLKVYSLSVRLLTGALSYGVRGLFMYGLPVCLVLWAAAYDETARRARLMLVPVGIVWLYGIYVGGDAFLYLRFFGPITPLLWTAVGLAVSASWHTRPRSGNVLLVSMLALIAPVANERGLLGDAWNREGEARDAVTAAKTIERNVPLGKTVATFYAGLPYYAPKHSFIDVLGKVESHIAHQTVIHGALPGHNKFDFTYVYDERRPDVTYTALSCDDVDKLQAMPVASLQEMISRSPRYIYQASPHQMLDPTFRALYYPNRVVARDGEGPAGHILGCWFVRQGSDVPIVWNIARE